MEQDDRLWIGAIRDVLLGSETRVLQNTAHGCSGPSFPPPATLEPPNLAGISKAGEVRRARTQGLHYSIPCIAVPVQRRKITPLSRF